MIMPILFTWVCVNALFDFSVGAICEGLKKSKNEQIF